MSRPRKYPKTTGHYNYAHILPNEMFYIGESGQQPCYRWRPSAYKNTVLGPYIKEIGWDNIRHVVLVDGLTEEQSVKLEGLLIEEAKRQGFCINEQGSGGIYRDNPKEYRRMQAYKYKTKRKEYRKEYDQRPEVKEHRREYTKTEKYKEYQREYSKTEKYKEYQREWHRQYYLKKKQGI